MINSHVLLHVCEMTLEDTSLLDILTVLGIHITFTFTQTHFVKSKARLSKQKVLSDGQAPLIWNEDYLNNKTLGYCISSLEKKINVHP